VHLPDTLIYVPLLCIKVFLGGYVPNKYQTANTKTGILGLNEAIDSSFPCYFQCLSLRIVKTTNIEGCHYLETALKIVENKISNVGP
jgi:hypothetical protein